MKYVKMSAWAKIPLKKEAELVNNPDDINLKCLKIGRDYYDVDIMLMKYSKKEKCWIETNLEDILDKNYITSMNGNIREISSPPKIF
jgi:hypothetical protein